MVDFPGVDDEDNIIGDLADLLITVAQIILFVVDYRYMCVEQECLLTCTVLPRINAQGLNAKPM